MSVTLLCCLERGSRLTKQQCCRLKCFLLIVKFCFQDDDTDGHTDTDNKGQEVKWGGNMRCGKIHVTNREFRTVRDNAIRIPDNTVIFR